MNAGLGKVEEKKQQLDHILAEKRKQSTSEQDGLQRQIAALNAKEKETAARLSAATVRVVELEERIRSLNDERSLGRFLVDRTRSEDYRKHLGLISTIRHDFESLNARLDRARSSADKTLQPVDRIILYIDDLDRCPADKVMEVLQAVHLLLAYPLFIVVVGVDPRWLLHSLGTTYSAFQSDSGRFSANPDLWRTTPQNYLEKIFQIPFNLRPMTDTGFGSLIKGLLSPSPLSAQTPSERALSGTPPPSGVDTVSSGQPDSSEHRDSQPASDSQLQFAIHEESLVITPWEAAFAESLFSLIPTPRAAKRFTNIYRILKAPIRRERLPSFEGTSEMPGDFQVPMLLLAILIGGPPDAAALFPRLQRHAGEGRDMLEALQQFATFGLSSPALTALQDGIRPIITKRGFPSTPEVFLEWIPRVSRFSFELARTSLRQPATAFQMPQASSMRW